MFNNLFSIGPLTVHMYGLMIAIGILMAFYVSDKRGKAQGLDMSKLDWLALSLLVGGFAGAKLLYWITILPQIIQDPSIMMDFGNGWVVYGGIIGGIAGGWLYCHLHGMNFWKYFDLIIPQVAMAQGFGRLGCFFAGCCYGVEVHEFGLIFPEGSLAPAGVPLFPTQLLSSAYDFLMFFVLIKLAKKTQFPGEVGAWYMIFYAIGRFIIEFFRGDLERGGVGVLSTSQFISIFILAAGLIILFMGRHMMKKRQQSKN